MQYYHYAKAKPITLFYSVNLNKDVSYVKLPHPLSGMRRMHADKIRELRARGAKVRKLTAYEYYTAAPDEYLNHDWRGVMRDWRIRG